MVRGFSARDGRALRRAGGKGHTRAEPHPTLSSAVITSTVVDIGILTIYQLLITNYLFTPAADKNKGPDIWVWLGWQCTGFYCAALQSGVKLRFPIVPNPAMALAA